MAHRPLLACVALAVLWLGVILLGALALYGTRPPAVVSESAPSNAFSAARAMAHLAEIAKHTHPIGSDDAVRVREYLVAKLTELGGETHVEQGIGSVHYARNVHAGLVNNVVATFRGASNSRAIMLVAHYDSVPEGPGAADDGAGLVVILEAIRALRTGPAIRNDLIVLFSDGEEAHGLLGARSFCADHRDLADRVGMMVNLEARGSSGPGLMFETSNDNGALIREFARSAPYPMASSFMTAIYKLLPNDTDFTPLKAAGLPGLNFAFIETYESYHTRLDTIENLDARSVQHVGNNVLGIIRHFGNLTLPLTKERDLVYFNWFGSRLLIYPVWFAWVSALLAPILFAFTCVRSAPRFGLTLGRVAAGFGTFLLQLLVIAGGSAAAFVVAKSVAGELFDGDTLSNQLVFAGVMGVALGLAIVSQRLLGNKLGLANLAAGQLFAVSLLTLVLCWLLVGGSYVLQWPLVFAMAGLVLALRASERVRPLFQLVFLIPAFLILVPLAYMFFVALTLTYLALVVASFLLACLLAMAPFLFDRLASQFKLTLLVIFLVSATLIGAGAHVSDRSPKHPRRDSLIYSVNADQNKAKWVSYDDAPDFWTTGILGSTVRPHSDPAFVAGLERPVLSTDATLIALSSPSVTVSADTTIDAVRTLKLQLVSTRGARLLVVRLAGEVKLVAAGWNGHVESIHDQAKINFPWTLRFYNVPLEGASLELRFSALKPIRVWLTDTTPGLPAIPSLSPRPADTTPGYASDITMVGRAYEF
ncbi:MAG: M20/M25/M40 family metallo-hydrolase [Chthoniobacterales bacterium]